MVGTLGVGTVGVGIKRGQLVRLFEEGLSPKEIADVMEIDELDVRTIIGADIVRDLEVDKEKVRLTAMGIGRELPGVIERLGRYSPAAKAVFEAMRDEEAIEGLPLDKVGRRRLVMLMEKVAGGMRYETACDELGLGADFVDALCAEYPLLDLWRLECRHGYQMEAMGAVAASIDRGDGKLALDVLSRQTADFRPAKARVEVTGGSGFREAWKVIDATVIARDDDEHS